MTRGARHLAAATALLALLAGPGAPSASPERLRPNLILNACAGTGGDTDYWQRAIKHGDAPARARAATALGETRAAEASPALVEALGDEDARVRLAAVRALARIGGDGVVRPLSRALGDPSADVRAAAARALDSVRRRATR